MDYLTSFFAGGFSLPYEIGEKRGSAWGKWEHFDAARTADKKPFSLFRMTVPKAESLTLEAARNGVRRLRTTKHPRVVAFEWAGETESGGNAVLYVVTERVQPLSEHLAGLELDGDEQRSMYIAMGLRQIVHGVAFLNNTCKMIHGNVCMDTVLVTSDLDWKLGYFDIMSEHAHLATSLLARCGKFVAEYYKPPELQRSDMEAVTEGPAWGVDGWGLGCFMQEVFSGTRLTGQDQLRNMAVVPKEITSEYQKLLGQNPARRLNPNKLSDCEYLKNDLVDVVHFLENLSIREPLEKTKFFRGLPKLIPQLPPVVCTAKLLPLISSALEYGGAPAMALGCLLQIGKMLGSDDAFKSRVVPIISALFSSSDYAIRNSLISNINEYGPFLSETVVESSIFPQLSKGLMEHNAWIREQSLKAMLPLAPKLTQRTLNGPLLKHLAKLQVDPEPSIRANTTVLLGNIAPVLGAPACKRILLNAFTRAMKDSFPPSRIAAMKALMATASYHSPVDAATRIVPAVAPSMLDPTQEVRQTACAVMAFFMRALTQASSDMDKGSDPTKAAASQEAKDVASNVSSFLGWAISSISAAAGSTTTAATTPSQPARTSSMQLHSAPSSVGRDGTNGASSQRAGWPDEAESAFRGPSANGAAPSVLPDTGRLPVGKVDMSSLDQMASGDGWGDNDGWPDLDEKPVTPPRVQKPKPKPVRTKRDSKAD